MTRPLPSSVPYASLLTYSPKGTSETSKNAKRVCYALKDGKDDVIRQAVVRLGENMTAAGLAEFFGNDVTLVPMPRSSLLVAGALWPAERICKEIVAQGLARTVETSLRRVTAVPKSAYAKQGERPGVDKHLETMEATPWLAAGSRITLVDDVITAGRTLYAGCVLVQNVVPGAKVQAFGMVRTNSYVHEVERIVDPKSGLIKYNYGYRDVRREP